MSERTQLALTEAAEWLGDWHPLAEQLGSASGLVTLGSVSTHLRLDPVRDVPSLRIFLNNYQHQILQPLEWPAIRAAHGHAEANELRELVALDQSLADNPALKHFAEPSQRVGRGQLQKLRPLKDQRMVQRYLHAVECGEARGWHTLVYGLTLALYSLPLRQGLLGYAHQTTRGFIYSAAPMLRLSERDCRQIFEDLCEPLPARLFAFLQQESQCCR